MARKKYNWEKIKADYDDGMSQAEIIEKHGVTTGALGNRIKRDGWKLSQEQNDSISGFKESVVRISENLTSANETQAELMVEAIVTTLEDNKLIQNNRRLSSMAQSILVANKDNFNAQNIRNLTGAIKDIEAIANPTKPNQINVQQNNTTEIKQIEVKFIE